MKFFDKFFNKNDSNSNSNEQDMTGGAANINNSDFNEDDDLFLDIESWGERIAKSSS